MRKSTAVASDIKKKKSTGVVFAINPFCRPAFVEGLVWEKF